MTGQYDPQNVNFAEIEKRARQLRAEALRDGFGTFRKMFAGN